MPVRKTKDYYQVLKIAPQATLAEIKKAYRALAYEYHPDKNPDNQYAVHQFHEIQEAYEVLAVPQKRAAYDEERWLSGFAQKKTSQPVTSQWIYTESVKLASHIASIDTYWMSHRTLSEYVHMLLSDANIAILKNEQNIEYNRLIITQILKATQKLEYRYFEALVDRLKAVAETDPAAMTAINANEKRKKKEMQWLKLKPYLIVAIALVLCAFMILYVRLIK